MNKDLMILNEKGDLNTPMIPDEFLPKEIKEGFNDVKTIIREEKSLPQLYGKILAEIPISSSLFQDKCVQYDQHFTPHKKLRQAMLELDDRLRALYAAKTGHKKAVLKVEKMEYDLDILGRETETSDTKGMFKLRKKEINLEEANRGLDSAAHLVKDAMLKVVQQRNLVNVYQKEVEDSGLSFEESEVIYYVMYFTKDAESQLRTMNRIDTGTFGAIAQTPTPIRMKILQNIDFLKKKIFEENWNGDYLHIEFEEILKPKKTGPGEFEGMNVADFLKVTPIKVLSPEITND